MKTYLCPKMQMENPMKYLAFVLVVLSMNAHALSYKAQCIGNGGKMAIHLYTDKDKLVLKYDNARGAEDFPFYEGSVTKAGLPFIQLAEKELSEIDQEVMVTWPIEKCTFNVENPLLMTCNGAGTFLLPEKTKLETYTFMTTMTKEESLSWSFDILKIRWGIEGENLHHSIVMPFDPSKCIAEFKK